MACGLSSLHSVAELDLDALRARWRKTFGSAAPAGAKRDLLFRLLAYRIQELEYGSVSRGTPKQLQALASSFDRHPSQAAWSVDATAQTRLGARLIRCWKGAAHEVVVLDQGFAYRGKHYRSLSEIAQLITGAHWSGPRFFGLKKSRDTSRPSVLKEQA